MVASLAMVRASAAAGDCADAGKGASPLQLKSAAAPRSAVFCSWTLSPREKLRHKRSALQLGRVNDHCSSKSVEPWRLNAYQVLRHAWEVLGCFGMSATPISSRDPPTSKAACFGESGGAIGSA